MEFKKGNKFTIKISVKDAVGAVVTNLATALSIKFMVKATPQDDDAAALISKTVGAGIVINSPVVGDVQITINAADTGALRPGPKYMALQIEYSATDIQEIYLKDGSLYTDLFDLKQDIIR